MTSKPRGPSRRVQAARATLTAHGRPHPRLTLIRPDGTSEERLCPAKIDLGPINTLAGWAPGYVEIIDCLWNGRLCAMAVHEEGRLRQMPVNELASGPVRAWMVGSKHRMDPDVVQQFVVFGNAVILEGCKLG